MTTQIILHCFPRPLNDWGIPNQSPFCVKIECFLKMANLEFVHEDVKNPRKSPNGKTPYITYNGKIMGDSGLIIDFLTKEFDDPVDKHLSLEQKAIGHAFRIMMENSLYWGIVYSRWIDPVNREKFVKPFKRFMPKLLYPLIIWKLLKNVINEMRGHGIGRHTESQVYAMCIDDLKAICTMLGDKPFFFGDTPSSIDACVYSELCNILHQPWETPMFDYLEKQENAIAYCQRMGQRYFPECPASQRRTFKG